MLCMEFTVLYMYSFYYDVTVKLCHLKMKFHIKDTKEFNVVYLTFKFMFMASVVVF